MKEKVVHLIIGLGKGGAETMLYQILKYRQNNYECEVISLGEGDYFKQYIEELGIKVQEYFFKTHPVKTLIKLRKELYSTKTLCCWMYHCNLIGYFVSKKAAIKRIIWCIRHSDLDPAHNKKNTLMVNRICARLSSKVSLILYNGEQAKRIHEKAGYCAEKGIVVDNGCDVREFKANINAGNKIRKELGIIQGKKIILSVTKDSPIKDVPTFIEAFADLRSREANVVAVMCGWGITPHNERIKKICIERKISIGKDIFLLGMRNDIPTLMGACDLFVLHSAGEAFPNTLIQAMACEALCITTDVGDARIIIDDDTCVIPPGNKMSLTIKMHNLLHLSEDDRAKKCKKNRDRVMRRYDIKSIVEQYEELLNER